MSDPLHDYPTGPPGPEEPEGPECLMCMDSGRVRICTDDDCTCDESCCYATCEECEAKP